MAQDLRPRPDALEYEEGARNLVHGLGYYVVVDGERYVPRYPFGLSLLIAPVLAVWDAGPGTGIVVVLATAAGAIAGAWALGWLVRGLPGAFVAAAIVALSPAHVRFSELVMSDVPSSCGIAWLGFAALAALRARRGTGAWAAIGAGLGLLASVRVTNVFLVIPIAALLTVARGVTRRVRLPTLVALGLGTLGGMAPLLVYDTLRFGGPLRTGYDVWVRSGSSAGATCCPPRRSAAARRRTSASTPPPSQAAAISTAFPPPFSSRSAPPSRCGAGRRPPMPRAEGGIPGPLLAFQCPFFWQDTRFLLPALPLLAALAAIPLGAGFRCRSARPARWYSRSASRSGRSARARTCVTSSSAKRRSCGRSPGRVEPDAAVLVRSNDHYVALLLQAPDRLWVPLGPDDHRESVQPPAPRARDPRPGRAPPDRPVVLRPVRYGGGRASHRPPSRLGTAALPLDAPPLPGRLHAGALGVAAHASHWSMSPSSIAPSCSAFAPADAVLDDHAGADGESRHETRRQSRAGHGRDPGIGRTIASVFAREGAKVVLVGRTVAAGEAAQAEIIAGGRHGALRRDRHREGRRRRARRPRRRRSVRHAHDARQQCRRNRPRWSAGTGRCRPRRARQRCLRADPTDEPLGPLLVHQARHRRDGRAPAAVRSSTSRRASPPRARP